MSNFTTYKKIIDHPVKIPKSIQNYIHDRYQNGDDWDLSILDAVKDGFLYPEKQNFIANTILGFDQGSVLEEMDETYDNFGEKMRLARLYKAIRTFLEQFRD